MNRSELRRCVWVLIACVLWLAEGAGAASLFERADASVPLVQAGLPGTQMETDLGGGSLFAGRQKGGLFAPVAPRQQRVPTLGRVLRPSYSSAALPQVAELRSLIARVEAGAANYDAVVFSARIKPPRRPTQMTLGEIYAWIEDTPGQNHAIGRYQFIPNTLREVAAEVGAPESAQFSPLLQDRLADVLLADAGLPAFLGGELDQTAFMNNLARIWAGLPNSTGRSHYHGIAGNKAGMSWSRFSREMEQIFPDARRAES